MTTTTNIIVLMGNEKTIGAIQSITIKETKVENSASVKLEIARIRLDRSKLSEVFDKGYFHVAAQKYPLHIVMLEDKKEIGRATNVWLSGIATSYTTDEWLISEGVEAECEFVSGTFQSDQSTST